MTKYNSNSMLWELENFDYQTIIHKIMNSVNGRNYRMFYYGKKLIHKIDDSQNHENTNKIDK